MRDKWSQQSVETQKYVYSSLLTVIEILWNHSVFVVVQFSRTAWVPFTHKWTFPTIYRYQLQVMLSETVVLFMDYLYFIDLCEEYTQMTTRGPALPLISPQMPFLQDPAGKYSLNKSGGLSINCHNLVQHASMISVIFSNPFEKNLNITYQYISTCI